MREIEFRGKRLDNGEWMYGYINYRGCVSHDTWYIFSGGFYRPIDGKTGGQFTGLFDDDKRKMFAGDIIDAVDQFNIKRRLEIKHIPGSFCCKFSCPEGEAVQTLGINVFKSVKIIGNIHENPELLEGK